jgi:hypothetical protein
VGGLYGAQVEGPLFFASARKFKALFNKEEDPDDVELHCLGMQIMDFSALDAIAKVASEYKALGKRFHLRFLRQVRTSPRGDSRTSARSRFAVGSLPAAVPCRVVHVQCESGAPGSWRSSPPPTQRRSEFSPYGALSRNSSCFVSHTVAAHSACACGYDPLHTFTQRQGICRAVYTFQEDHRVLAKGRDLLRDVESWRVTQVVGESEEDLQSLIERQPHELHVTKPRHSLDKGSPAKPGDSINSSHDPL